MKVRAIAYFTGLERLLKNRSERIMKKIYLIRHCEAEGQPEEAPLTNDGFKQAIQLSEFFRGIPVDRIISSPYKRALQTVEPLAKRMNLEIEKNELLTERVLSSKNLADWLEKLRATFDDFELKFEGGESSSEAQKRIITVMEEVLKSEELNTIIVTHGNLLSLLLNHYQHQFCFEDWRILKNPDVFLLKREDETVTYERLLIESSDQLSLIKPTIELKDEYLSFYKEWVDSKEDMVPWVIQKDPSDFEAMVQFLMDNEQGRNLREGWVPDSTFWLINQDKRILGAVNIRHQLTPFLLNSGGHIGYGIRPSERRKGFATKLLSLSIEKAKELGIRKALVVCDEDNTGSFKTIINNGGIPDSDFIEEDGNIVKRFWIEL
ncbi:MAG: acetyltransferase, family protein [Neobacillus sp.]|nr:acetyltransferase, family protein [Neobacillus sp.]